MGLHFRFREVSLDIEAPGLHTYFKEAIDKDKSGLVDFITESIRFHEEKDSNEREIIRLTMTINWKDKQKIESDLSNRYEDLLRKTLEQFKNVLDHNEEC